MMKVWNPTNKEKTETINWEEWSKEVSEFPWVYDETETCFILEGEAEVTNTNGEKVSFKAGDMVQFKKGINCKWKITKDLRKKYYFG